MSGMVPFERALVSFYRPSIVTEDVGLIAHAISFQDFQSM